RYNRPQDHGDDDCDDDDDDPRNRKWEGAIVSLPASSQMTGTWVLSIDENRQLTVTATADTRFRPEGRHYYHVGQWVEVKGHRQPDGSLVAERIRVDDYEAGEIVVRLRDG